MTTIDAPGKLPLWLQIEESILGLSSNDLEPGKYEQTVAKTARALDELGHNVSKNGGNLLQLRWALDARIKAGKPMMKDLNDAVTALTLEDVTDSRIATNKLTDGLKDWPELSESSHKADVHDIVKHARLNLYVEKAKELGGEAGIRYLIADGVPSETIVDRMGITEDEYKRVNAAVEAEKAERVRVRNLVEAAGDKPEEEKIKKLINENVSDELMVEIGGFGQAAIDNVKKAMEAEIKEKERKAAEEAARKKAEAEGPSLDTMDKDEIIEHIESIREIMEFTDQEKEIRVMAEQSNIPKAIVDIAVQGEDALDELEKKAEG